MADEKNASTMGPSTSPDENGSNVPVTVKKSRTTWVPDWVMRNVKSPATWKLLLSLIMPPSLPAQLFILVMITLIFGCLLGCGLGAAAMKAALAVRDQVRTAQELQTVKSSVAGLANPDALFEVSIFQGQFLDTKSTIMFGAFLAIGTFIAAFVRAYYPKLALMSLYLTTFIDIFCSYGPLFPFAQYTILNSFLESVAFFTAVALVVTFFIFPETLSHQWLNDGVTMLGFYRDLIEIQDDVLGADPNAGELTPGSELGDRIVAKKELMLAKYQAPSGAETTSRNSNLTSGDYVQRSLASNPMLDFSDLLTGAGRLLQRERSQEQLLRRNSPRKSIRQPIRPSSVTFFAQIATPKKVILFIRQATSSLPFYCLLQLLKSWNMYIGAPMGVGTPYGIAAVIGVFFVPLLFIRIFSLYQLESIMFTLSKSLLEILELYTSVISTWMYAEDNKMPSDKFIKLWAPKFRERLLDVGTKLYSMRASVKLAKWEGAYRCNWRSEEYASLVERQIEMVGAIAQLSGALQNLPVEWRRRLLHRTKFLNPDFVNNGYDMVSVLSAISQSLQTGQEEIQDELIKEVEGLAFLQSLEFMSYASAVTSVADLLATVDEVHRITKRMCGEVPLRGYERWQSTYDPLRIFRIDWKIRPT
ncbi:hypothetical protein SISSUDRAFT_1038424 [Sistotremastrum suecicum HHB10207 ss-3]|uniref:ER transporter 6TM N-terminal domain-containing protein n=1 Tax=Sistotremastrum suecicum HHB10207 ss-3 TaxID=1314776 RepID=A0A165WRL5_9AGAM|nr:hypothetical protein SISSUDRAFT_1038424 [Sistotremastrum suecicum HHB10207 ss-3]